MGLYELLYILVIPATHLCMKNASVKPNFKIKMRLKTD